MSAIEIGQVLSLKIRFNNSGDVAHSKHPYLVIDIDDELGTVEIAQLDSIQGKEHKAAMRSNKMIFNDNPTETVIDKDSYAQLDNTIKLENFPELLNWRRQEDKLSDGKLQSVIGSYRRYHENYEIDENKNVYMDKHEILELNEDKQCDQ